MTTRMSFTLESKLSDQIEQFAQEMRIDRNEAILRLIEAGVMKYSDEMGFIPIQQERGFQEVKVIKRSLDNLTATVSDLKKEIRVVHHILDLERQKESRPLQMKARRWWEFWKGI